VGDSSTVLRIGGDAPAVALPAVNVSIEPGRCYVSGVMCELEVRASFAQQPGGGATGAFSSPPQEPSISAAASEAVIATIRFIRSALPGGR
jgi:hypothetical protein